MYSTPCVLEINRRHGRTELVVGSLLRAPDVARFWANTHHVAYRSPQQILWVRIRRMLKR